MRADACVGEGGVKPVRAHSLEEAEILQGVTGLGWVKHLFQLTQIPPSIYHNFISLLLIFFFFASFSLAFGF